MNGPNFTSPQLLYGVMEGIQTLQAMPKAVILQVAVEGSGMLAGFKMVHCSRV